MDWQDYYRELVSMVAGGLDPVRQHGINLDTRIADLRELYSPKGLYDYIKLSLARADCATTLLKHPTLLLPACAEIRYKFYAIREDLSANSNPD
jgi:hypothetical protein